MLTFYYHPGPNPAKVALFLEEAELAYTLSPVDTRRGEQFRPEFLRINPNAKTPAVTDGEVTLFDSTAILLYLAEKTGRFLPEATPVQRAQLLSWMLFIASGVGPYTGQAVHFKRYAPEPVPYAENRYMFEAKRHFDILEARLGTHRYMLGDRYTIADMSLWGWARALPFLFGPEGWAEFPNLRRLCDEIDRRPAAIRADQLKDRAEFKTEMDAEALKHLFPQNAALKAG